MRASFWVLWGLVGALFSASAHSALLVLWWLPATHYEDGTVIGANYKGVKIVYGTCASPEGAIGEVLGQVEVPWPSTHVVIPVGWGQFCMSAVTQVKTGVITESYPVNLVSEIYVEGKEPYPAGMLPSQ
jgi:hypothetical protein